ncbi:hypothetical protein [Nibricoccus sp. IMCC34717]|uniref:hypothetical protein n=1 Tax=Nibricoccus sp. IMCC34717 TaxID=3034021 RepID=UPI00384D47D5
MTPRLLALLLLALPATAPAFEWFPRVEGNVVVVTDVTEAGRKFTPPTPQAPVFFKGLSLGNKLGSIPGDREPDVKKLTAFATKLLAKQGYVGSFDDTHPASLFLVLQWGYIRDSREQLWFLGYNPFDDIGYQPNPNMLGPEVLLRNMRNSTVETILDLADEPIYGLIITAFDYATVKTDKPIALWQTRIGFAAIGKSMQDALPKMLTVGAAQIGRASDKPIIRDADDYRKEAFEYGDLKVVPDPVEKEK